ncbi:hypothetical protein O181_096081 [Austropuccinia psidii MF-1]|uniref:Uncharacterized protein n=1 Tax=Austropuccinia psidii MF-1 TaxID=1389203 RepID=A0A9Q3J6Q7_9BASI|nr:hypothetical protein [Austropuccinia psidii MF-1]
MSIPISTKNFIRESSLFSTPPNFDESPQSNSRVQHYQETQIAPKTQNLQLIIHQYLHIPTHYLIFNQVLEKAKKVSTRTSSQSSIDSESSDEQNNPPPQMSTKAVFSKFQNNKNNRAIPPPPKVIIPQPSTSISPLHPNPLLKKEALRNLMKSPIPKSILEGYQEAFLDKNPLSSLQKQEILRIWPPENRPSHLLMTTEISSGKS